MGWKHKRASEDAPSRFPIVSSLFLINKLTHLSSSSIFNLIFFLLKDPDLGWKHKRENEDAPSRLSMLNSFSDFIKFTHLWIHPFLINFSYLLKDPDLGWKHKRTNEDAPSTFQIFISFFSAFAFLIKKKYSSINSFIHNLILFLFQDPDLGWKHKRTHEDAPSKFPTFSSLF